MATKSSTRPGHQKTFKGESHFLGPLGRSIGSIFSDGNSIMTAKILGQFKEAIQRKREASGKTEFHLTLHLTQRSISHFKKCKFGSGRLTRSSSSTVRNSHIHLRVGCLIFPKLKELLRRRTFQNSTPIRGINQSVRFIRTILNATYNRDWIFHLT